VKASRLRSDGKVGRVGFACVVVCCASASCAELLGIEEATVDASLDATTDSNADDVLSEGIRCGAFLCDPAVSECCLGMGRCQSLDASSEGSVTSGSCSGLLRCDEQADCDDAAVCCLTTDESGVSGPVDAHFKSSQCTGSCDNGTIMCNPDAAAPNCNCTGTVTLFEASYFTCEQ
jgi:hypothetical protein